MQDDYDGDDVYVYGCDMTRVKVDVVCCNRPKNSKYDQSEVLGVVRLQLQIESEGFRSEPM